MVQIETERNLLKNSAILPTFRDYSARATEAIARLEDINGSKAFLLEVGLLTTLTTLKRSKSGKCVLRS